MQEISTPHELGLREARAQLGNLAYGAAMFRRITYITNRGRRVAAIVAIQDAEAIERNQRQSDV